MFLGSMGYCKSTMGEIYDCYIYVAVIPVIGCYVVMQVVVYMYFTL